MDGFDKAPWRKVNAAFLDFHAKEVLKPKARQRGSGILDMPGPSGIVSYQSLAPLIGNDPSRYYGAEVSLPVLYDLHKQIGRHKMSFQVSYGDVYRISMQLAQQGRVAVYIFDTQNQTGNPTWWERDGRSLSDITLSTLSHWPLCCYIFNHVLDRGPGTPSDRILEHSSRFIEQCSRMGVTSVPDLLPSDLEALNSRSFKGRLGAYDFYRSSNKTLRMATLRLLFRKSREGQIQVIIP